jgi:hypothetical protein
MAKQKTSRSGHAQDRGLCARRIVIGRSISGLCARHTSYFFLVNCARSPAFWVFRAAMPFSDSDR